MQVMPATGEWIAQIIRMKGFNQSKLFDSDTAINLGTWYISHLMKRFKGDPLFVAAAYNAGPGNAMAWKEISGGDPDLYLEVVRFEETRQYIRFIYEIFSIYRRLYGET